VEFGLNIDLPERYRLHEKPLLGEGGMGRVLRVHDVVLDCPVALKVVRPDLAADKRFRRLFDLEVKISARFTHPNIVPLHDLGSLGDGTPFLGLAFADAGSFANLVDDESWDWSELRRLTVELLDALAHLHARDVLHRDLKPENILLHRGEDDLLHVWLADLGLAKASSKLIKKRGRMEGTPGYMSPEQKAGEPREFGPWTDLYSLGIILWQLVTGDLPFGTESTAADMPLPAFVPRLAVPDGLELVLANLLCTEPLSRYDLAADLKQELLGLKSSDIAAGVRTGTVAPSVDNLSTEREAPDGSAPRWNRPIPSILPAEIPDEPGMGATARASLALFTVRELPVVARDTYRQQLWDQAYAVATEKTPRVVVVSGEAGCGKSSLVTSVLRSLEEGGWAETVSLDYHSPPGAEDGYQGAARALIRPWNETRESLVDRLARTLGRAAGGVDDSVLEQCETLARWSGICLDDEEAAALGYGLREVYRHLEAVSWRGLSVLTLDDAQWAVEEGDGLAIAEAVLQSATDGDDRSLLVVLTVRDEDISRDRDLKTRVEALVEAGAEWIQVPRLDQAGMNRLLSESVNLDPQLARKVVSRCQGNPLFARQLLVDWSTRGWLVDVGGLRYGLAAGVNSDSIIPDDARDLFRRRVAAIVETSENSRRFRDTLHLSALAGLTQPKVLLESIAGAEMADYIRACGLWQRRDDSVYFDHGLLYQVVLEEAEARQDVSYMHKRLARAWRKYGEASGVDVSFRVGRHACLGGAWSMAAPCLLEAAEVAWQRGRTNELREASRLAVRACSVDPALQEVYGRAVLWFARSFEAQGEAKEAGQQYARARGLCRESGDHVGDIQAGIGQGWAALECGELDEAAAFYSETMKASRGLKDLQLEALSIRGMAWLEQKKRNFDGADILFTRVLNRSHQLSDARGMASAALGQAFVARQTGAFRDAEELYEEAIETFREADDLVGVARALSGCATALRQQARWDEAQELLRESISISEDLGATKDLMEARLGLAEVYRDIEDVERARPIYENHLGWSLRQGNFEGAIFAHLGLGMACMRERNTDGVFKHAEEAAALLEQVPGHWLWATYRLLVASMLALRDDEKQTYQWLWSASELGLNDIADIDVAENLYMLVQIGSEHRWPEVVRLAGKLGMVQYERLQQADKARTIRDLINDLPRS
jgi:eukaryotic-like serine/threonine-protein kinase